MTDLVDFRRFTGNPAHRARAVLTSLVAWAAIVLEPSVGWCTNERMAQGDAVQNEDLLNCDRQAERETAEASKLSPIAPTSVLNPILLLNDLHRRKQEEENQPLRFQQIEEKRQQCRRNVVAATTRRAQEVIDQKSDAARGYKQISFETFALDGKSLAATKTRVSMRGAYLPDGNFEWLFPGQVEAIHARRDPVQGRNIPKIPLLTEDASRDFRKTLLTCKSTPGADQIGCLTVITGHVSLCTVTGPLDSGTALPCIVVENGRAIR